MDQLAQFLQAVGYCSVVAYPYLAVYPHLLASALFPIYAGAHASLSRPSAAAKPSKRSRKRGHDDEPEEREQAMEGLNPIDALVLPLFAGLLLTSLYYLIKWLEDPALLNKILNWYLTIVGVWSFARMLADGMGIFTSFVFPKIYDSDSNTRDIDARHGKSKLTSSPSVDQKSPISTTPSVTPLPSRITNALWIPRELPSRQLEVQVYIRGIVQTRFKIGLQGITSFFLAVAALLYFNLIGKPWWLTNLLGFSFAYSALQIMSPTTSWTGTLILSALFIYDIYFVFFTPVMITVATQLDIPAKLVFPRPSRPTEDPTKQALSMLGLGDVIVPGMMIGFALRFDLYLFYLRKQTRRTIRDYGSSEDLASDPMSENAGDSEIVKAKWHSATGGWGERFWFPKNDILKSKRFQGVLFPKTYFHASIIGYFLAMICTLVVVDIYRHAQPALLYLVPGVLGSLWGTAFVKGDLKTLWAFDEFEDEQGHTSTSPSKNEKQDSAWKKDSWMDVDWKSLFLSSKSLNDSNTPKKATENDDASDPVGKGYSKRVRRSRSGDNTSEKSKRSGSSAGESTSSQSSDYEAQESKRSGGDRGKKGKENGAHKRDRNSELIFISVNFPKTASAMTSNSTPVPEQTASSAHVAHRTRARTKAEDAEDGGLGESG